MSEDNAINVSVRLKAAGLHPAVTSSVIKTVDAWETHHGTEWTVRRLKSLKVDFVRHLAGKPPVGDYAKRSSGLPKGVFGYLFSLGLTSRKSRRKLHTVWNALIIYTRFVSPDVTRQQWKKFSTAVRGEPPEKGELASAMRYVSLGIRTLPVAPQYRGKPKSILLAEPREGKRAPLGRVTVPEKSSMLQQAEFAWQQNGPVSRRVWDDCLRWVYQYTPYGPSAGRKIRELPGRVPRFYSGMIGLIQEPGYKLRAVANPNRVYQLALYPLGRQLFSWLRGVPEDCTYNQHAGVYAVQGVIGSGQRVWSFDLSNATDRYPLELMMPVARRGRAPLGALQLLECCARGDWYLPMGSTVSQAHHLVWRTGLPLGLYPCFALFSLSHHALLRGICVVVGRRDFPYRILGDDIVIWDDKVAEEYQRVMGEIRCPIAMDKSIDSPEVAEFAGRVILANTILHGQKYRTGNDNSFLETVKFLGPKTIRYLPPKQRRVARHVSELIPPVGFGWNPEGKPFLWRLIRTLAWLDAAPVKAEQTAIALIRVAFSNWYASTGKLHQSSTGVWSKDLNPDSLEQWESSLKAWGWGDVKPQLLHGNVQYLMSQYHQSAKAGEIKRGRRGITGWMKEVLRVSTPAHPDHPFSKPLVQSLEARRLRAVALEATLERQLLSVGQAVNTRGPSDSIT